MRLEHHGDIPVDPSTRILVWDTKKHWRGYTNRVSCLRILVPKDGHTIEETIAELENLLIRRGLLGIPVERMSTLTYVPFTRNWGGGSANPKHRQSCFQLMDTYAGYPPSRNWGVVARNPSPDDVYVRIFRFEPLEWNKSFFSIAPKDRDMLEFLFGIKMPTIYGIKDSEKPETIVGTPYREWRERVVREALEKNPEVLAAFRAYQTHSVQLEGGWGGNERELNSYIFENLDKNHVLYRFLQDRLDAAEQWRSFKKSEIPRVRSAFDRLGNIFTKTEVPAYQELQEIYRRYPLLRRTSEGNQRGLNIFGCREVRDVYLEYVHLVDLKGK